MYTIQALLCFDLACQFYLYPIGLHYRHLQSYYEVGSRYKVGQRRFMRSRPEVSWHCRKKFSLNSFQTLHVCFSREYIELMRFWTDGHFLCCLVGWKWVKSEFSEYYLKKKGFPVKSKPCWCASWASIEKWFHFQPHAKHISEGSNKQSIQLIGWCLSLGFGTTSGDCALNETLLSWYQCCNIELCY